jgi:CBS domain-containing protein
MEGRTAGRRRAIQVARQDIPTCRAAERLGDVHDRVRAAGHDVCIVVNDDRVVLGRLRGKVWENDPNATVEDVMQLGPATIRPDPFLHEIVERLQRRKIGSILVTSYGSHEGGRLLGVLYREDVERVLAESRASEP